MKNILTLNDLRGYRTYILMALLFVAGGLKAIGAIDDGTYQAIFALLVPAGIVTLRMAK